MITDPIADMLTRIRNALVARHDHTDVPASKLKLALAEVLKKEGYIRDFEPPDGGRHGPGRALGRESYADMQVKLNDSQLLVTRPSDQAGHRAMPGLPRSLIANMVSGVSEGFSKTLEMQG